MKANENFFKDAGFLSQWVILGMFAVGLLSGCATVSAPPQVPAGRQGVYHKVKKGETLWRIAQTYDVNVKDIIASNNIPDAAEIEQNQLIFIPGASSVREVAPTVVTNVPVGTKPSASAVKDDFVWPLQGRVTKYFGERDGSIANKGIKIEAHEGDQVVASRQGKVIFADYLSGYAYTVVLDHLDGYFSVYAHNSKILVSLGAVVPQGTPIASVGRKGILLFEIRKNAMADNPLYYLPKL